MPESLQSVLQLLGRPPRVERHDDGAREDGAPERDDPLGEVARRDGDAVALGDAVSDEAVGQRRGDRGSARRR